MNQLYKLLQKYWGYTQFRTNQLAIIEAVLQKKHVLAVLPTGGGKSLCFQLPALYLEGLTLVVSPLIALMNDQVLQLNKRGIAAACIHGQLSNEDIHQILSKATLGEYKLLYVAPERLQSSLFLDYLPTLKVELLAVDEAHCISQWGHDFRPLYLKIASVKQYFPAIPILALTASATLEVQQDIVQYLQIENAFIVRQSIFRFNISYKVSLSEAKVNDMVHLLKQQDGVGIVYCRSRKRCEQIALQLQSQQLEAYYYHAGLTRPLRDKVQHDWLQSNKAIICATTAFGMGIDKPDVRSVVHVDLPENIEAYYQEVGRAGRDTLLAQGLLLYTPKDIEYLKEKTIQSFPPVEFVKSVYAKVHDYLKIGLGDGFERFYSFEVMTFIQTYKLPVLSTLASIKLLERDSFWVWNESNVRSATIWIIQERVRLQQLQQYNLKYYEVIEACMRLYGSLYTYPTPVDTYKIAKLLGIDKVKLDTYLQALHDMEIIQYQATSSGGSLFMLQSRLPLNYVKLDIVNYKRQQQNAYYKISQLIAYIENDAVCRSQLLAHYFGEKESVVCGICDNCIKKNALKYSLQAFKAALLHKLENEERIPLQSIELLNTEVPKGQLFNYLRRLIDQKIITVKDAFIYKLS